MIRQATAILFIFFASSYEDGTSWTLSIKPDAGHIRANKSTIIICTATERIDQCRIKIDGRDTLDFSRGPNSRAHLVTNQGRHLYGARYAGTGLKKGQCGVGLTYVAAGVYVVGCQVRNELGSLRMNYMTLTVDDSQPLRMKVNRKYQVTAPGSEVAILCSTERKQPLDLCAVRLPSKQWVTFPKGHLSKETDRYHYHGRGLEKGHCGVTLVDVTQAESGLVLCHVKAGGKSAIRGGVIKVARPKPETEITWDEKTHVAPGDFLDAECVMRGAYPLPPMVWTFESKVVKSSDNDETVRDVGTFKWPWEDHVIKQKLSVPVGSKLGIRTLKCEAADVIEVLDVPQISKYTITDRNEIAVHVHPTCGMRTNTTYNMAHPRRPIRKRDVKTEVLSRRTDQPNGSGVLGSKNYAPVKASDADTPTLKTSTSSPPKISTVAVDVDYVEPVWDEAELEPVSQKNPVQIPEDFFESPALGIVGAVSVLGPDHYPVPMTLPPPSATPEEPPAPIFGGHMVLNSSIGNIIPYPDESPPIEISLGGTEVLKFPDLDKRPIAQSFGGTAVFHEGSSGGFSAGGTEVFNKIGRNVYFVTYPWTAGIYKKSMGKYSQQCGGTLVTETHVICAAHCFWIERESKPQRPGDYQVSLGRVFREWDLVDAYVQNRGVRQLHLHPVFRGRKRNFQHDISVIELDHAVVYTPRVAPACLDWDNYFEDRQLVKGSIGVVTGWGYTEDEKPSEVLRYVELPYVDANTCYDKLPETMQLLLTTDKFCAGFSNRNVSVCPGDSGGGLLFQEPEFGAYFLRGVVSVSFRPPEFQGKCYHSEVTGFTLVSQSMSWLKGILNYH